VAAFLPQIFGAYFRLEDGQNKCFLEEVPKDTLILGKYKAWDANNDRDRIATDVGLKLNVIDPTGKPLLQKELNPTLSGGKIAFTSQIQGEHKICFQTNSTRWFGSKKAIKVELYIKRGEAATDYEEIARQDHLSEIEVEVKKLIDRVRDIRAEQNYQRSREIEFRDTSESTNSRVVWWSILQTAILVATGLWQVTHLKKFFKAKKLV
jgi:hypothetical protein